MDDPVLKRSWRQFLAGQGTLDILLGSSLRLLEAERLLSQEKSNQLAALEHHLGCMRESENVSQARFDAARIAIMDLAQPQFYRIQAELWLEQAKSN
jgi:hypothetical protein